MELKMNGFKLEKIENRIFIACLLFMLIGGYICFVSPHFNLQCYAGEDGFSISSSVNSSEGMDGGTVEAGYTESSGGESSGESGGSASASGYTPEQIAAAKAWLSSHGYAPTRAGGNQAYQDYLDGKLDNDPDVRKYKGLDSNGSSSSNSSAGSVNGTPDKENLGAGNTGAEKSGNDPADNSVANNIGNSSQGKESQDPETASVDFDNMGSIIGEENDSKQELENSLDSSKDQLKLQDGGEGGVVLIPEEAEEIKASKDHKGMSKVLFYLMMSFVFFIIFVSLYKLNQKDKQ